MRTPKRWFSRVSELPQRTVFRTTLTEREGVVMKHRGDLGGVAVELESTPDKPWTRRVVRPDLTVCVEEV
jgi:hypothetical protein